MEKLENIVRTQIKSTAQAVLFVWFLSFDFGQRPRWVRGSGTWGEILFNSEECISSISGCINHFINNSNKTEIIFGISNKDYDCVISKINTEKCVIETVRCENL